MRRWRPCSLTIPLAVALSATTCIPGAVAFLSTPRMPVSGSGRVQLRPNGMLYGGRPWEQTTAVTGCSGLSRREVNRRTRPTGWKMGVGNVGEGNEGEGDAAVSEYSAWPTINRKAIGAMASAGALESAFLTYQKLKPGGLDLLCGASGGCADVLSGPYSDVLGVPLSAFGMLGYFAVAGLALVPLLLDDEAVDKSTRSLLLMITTAMGVFSVYLLSLLKFKIGYPCPWCLTSAGLSLSMCTVAWLKRAVPEKTKAAVMGVCTTLVTAFACLTIFVVTETALDIRQAEASPGELVGLQLIAAPKIDTVSSPQALRIGKKLKSLDSKMYGAYWCTHCFNQKEILGQQAMAKVTYVECSNRGVDNKVEMCKAANIPGFPTWEIDGKLYPGEQTLEELEEIVGLDPFKG